VRRLRHQHRARPYDPDRDGARLQRKSAETGPTTFNLSFNEHCEIYMVRDSVWKAAGLEPMGGCICIGCLEKRIGRQLRPKDFTRHVFNSMPGTERLLQRRGAR
jgi:hypothetical protein